MLKKYCTSCGQATEYGSAPPSFCSKCGTSFSGRLDPKASLSAKTQKKKPRKLLNSEDYDEYAEEENYITSLSSLDFTIEKFEEPSRTIGDIVSLGSGGGEKNEKTKKNQNPLPKINEEAFLKDFEREAGSLRLKNNG